jgi:hypothetical protein
MGNNKGLVKIRIVSTKVRLERTEQVLDESWVNTANPPIHLRVNMEPILAEREEVP